jgi:lipopolysaccharide transport system ATP-binding protein
LVTGDTVEEFWALKDVSFEVKRGEVVGIIGRNGAGKSTLLKVLSRITEPSAGRVTIKGRVASLLEVGTGFHPELTGRENIFLNGAILGMTRAEIRRKFDEIVAFAEVEKFLDTPVKRYSSGMYVRLAFAVAAHLEPEILVVDEVLAVGDVEFQRKCLGKMGEVASGGRTILFVSHNLGAVLSLCPRSLLLTGGQLFLYAQTADTINAYVQQTGTHAGGRIAKKIQEGLTLDGVSVKPDRIETGASVTIEFVLTAKQYTQLREAAVLISSPGNALVAIVDFRESGSLPLSVEKGSVVLRGQIASLPLVEGDYLVGLHLVSRDFFGYLHELARFTITPACSGLQVIPYPPSARGIVALRSVTNIELVRNADAVA